VQVRAHEGGDVVDGLVGARVGAAAEGAARASVGVAVDAAVAGAEPLGVDARVGAGVVEALVDARERHLGLAGLEHLVAHELVVGHQVLGKQQPQAVTRRVVGEFLLRDGREGVQEVVEVEAALELGLGLCKDEVNCRPVDAAAEELRALTRELHEHERVKRLLVVLHHGAAIVAVEVEYLKQLLAREKPLGAFGRGRSARRRGGGAVHGAAAPWGVRVVPARPCMRGIVRSRRGGRRGSGLVALADGANRSLERLDFGAPRPG